MKTVREHYDDFLGSVYSWILGDFDDACARSRSLFESLGLEPGDGRLAVDLGAGPGTQTIPLAEREYAVVAVDFCAELLDELKAHAGDLPVTNVRDDLLRFRRHIDGPAALIVCMGDTLVHLPSHDAVTALLDEVSAALAPGGRFVYSIRDYVSFVPEGGDRFVPVRASDERIFTCFLEYGDDDVHVHDILYRNVDGHWRMQVSDYRKLRLDCAVLNARLASNGLVAAEPVEVDGLLVVSARKPA